MEVDVILKENEKEDVKIQGEVFKLGKIKYRQILKLTKAVTKMYMRNVKRFKELQSDGKNAFEDIANILDILDDSEVTDIMCIILERDYDYCIKLSAVEVSEIARVLYEFNYEDVSGTLKNWKSTIAKMNPQTTDQ